MKGASVTTCAVRWLLRLRTRASKAKSTAGAGEWPSMANAQKMRGTCSGCSMVAPSASCKPSRQALQERLIDSPILAESWFLLVSPVCTKRCCYHHSSQKGLVTCSCS